MKNEKTPDRVDRRRFLASVGTGAAGAATAVIAGTAAPAPAAAAESAADRKKKRYQPNSALVLTYYRTNRY